MSSGSSTVVFALGFSVLPLAVLWAAISLLLARAGRRPERFASVTARSLVGSALADAGVQRLGDVGDPYARPPRRRRSASSSSRCIRFAVAAASCATAWSLLTLIGRARRSGRAQGPGAWAAAAAAALLPRRARSRRHAYAWQRSHGPAERGVEADTPPARLRGDHRAGARRERLRTLERLATNPGARPSWSRAADGALRERGRQRRARCSATAIFVGLASHPGGAGRAAREPGGKAPRSRSGRRRAESPHAGRSAEALANDPEPAVRLWVTTHPGPLARRRSSGSPRTPTTNVRATRTPRARIERSERASSERARVACGSLRAPARRRLRSRRRSRWRARTPSSATTGAATTGPGEQYFHAEEVDPPSFPDPLEPANRAVSAVNHVLIVYVASPLGKVYRFVIPRFVRDRGARLRRQPDLAAQSGRESAPGEVARRRAPRRRASGSTPPSASRVSGTPRRIGGRSSRRPRISGRSSAPGAGDPRPSWCCRSTGRARFATRSAWFPTPISIRPPTTSPRATCSPGTTSSIRSRTTSCSSRAASIPTTTRASSGR